MDNEIKRLVASKTESSFRSRTVLVLEAIEGASTTKEVGGSEGPCSWLCEDLAARGGYGCVCKLTSYLNRHVFVCGQTVSTAFHYSLQAILSHTPPLPVSWWVSVRSLHAQKRKPSSRFVDKSVVNGLELLRGANHAYQQIVDVLRARKLQTAVHRRHMDTCMHTSARYPSSLYEYCYANARAF